jgi:hypothetical protein
MKNHLRGESMSASELSGSLADTLRALIRAELSANRGLPGNTSDEPRAIIDLMMAQLETNPKRMLAWD